MVTLMPPTSADPGSHPTSVSCGLSFNQSQSYSDDGFSPGPPVFLPLQTQLPTYNLFDLAVVLCSMLCMVCVQGPND